MAEAIAWQDASHEIEASSAGLAPLGFVADMTTQTLTKNGYAAAGLASKPIASEVWESADIIINMTGQPWEEVFANREKVEDWIVQDPYSTDPETYQRVLEGIQRRIAQLAKGLRDKREHRTAEK